MFLPIMKGIGIARMVGSPVRLPRQSRSPLWLFDLRNGEFRDEPIEIGIISNGQGRVLTHLSTSMLGPSNGFFLSKSYEYTLVVENVG